MFNVVLDPSCPSGNSQGLGEAFCVISRADGDSVCRVWVRGLCRLERIVYLQTILCGKVVESLVDRNDLQHLEPRALVR